MIAIPALEMEPAGLSEHWSGVWQGTRDALVECEAWGSELKPFLDEYVFALVAAESAREAGASTAWDRHAKRAMRIAELLCVTPRARRLAFGPPAAPEPDDPFRQFIALDGGA